MRKKGNSCVEEATGRHIALFYKMVCKNAACVVVIFCCILSACSNIDCPLDNVVMMQCNLYDSETRQAVTLNSILSVSPAGRDTILLNQASGISSFLLPLRESGTRDSLVFNFSNSLGQEALDTLFVDHQPQPHFESVDCPACVFHTITGASFTSHDLSEMPLTIDSVAVVRQTVNYDDIENIRIFLRSSSGSN